MKTSKLAGGFTGTIGKIDKLAHQAHGLLCMAVILGQFLSPANLLAALAQIAVGAANMILDAVGGLIQSRINGLLGLALLPLQMLMNYADRLRYALNGIASTFAGLETKADNLLNYIFNTQDCANQAADLMNCISKLIARKVTNKILPKIDSVFGKLQKEIAGEVFKTGGLLEQRVGRRVRSVERLNAQLSILR